MEEQLENLELRWQEAWASLPHRVAAMYPEPGG